MLRIAVVSQTKEEVVLKIEGWICGEDVGLLEQEGQGWRQQHLKLVLDLSGVRFIDPAGLALLRSWSGKGFALRQASMFVGTLLQAQGLAQAGETE